MAASWLNNRTFFGFKINEALLWIAFHISWPLLLATIYQITGRFNDESFMSFSRFISIQCCVLFAKSIVMLPLWWLFFVKLKNQPFSKKLALHFFTCMVYVSACLFLVYVMLEGILNHRYPVNARWVDVYNLILTYFYNFALFHAYNFWLETQKQMKKEFALKELAHQSEIKALKSQIEPHFLFNTLNSISASVPPALEKTRVMIAQLADTFRHALHVSEQEFVTLEEEITFLQNWLALEKHRFNNRLMVHYNIDESILQTQLPPMILQPLVENALNHGIAPKLEGGIVTIECNRFGEFAEIAVSDTGIGYKSDLKHMINEGIGLKNVSKRLQLLYNQRLNIKRNTEGLRFSFKIPLCKAYEKGSINC